MRGCSALGSLRAFLLVLCAVAAAVVTGCRSAPASPPEDADPAEALRRSFPEHAASVLRGSDAFVALGEGFATAPSDEPAVAVGRRGGLSAALPRRAEEAIRFHQIGGFEIRVREIGASGEGAIAGGAVAYRRRGGASFWSATEDGYEEWLMLGAGATKAEEPIASWEIEGAGAQEANGAVEIGGADGAARVRVTAPIAFGSGGRVVPTRLAVRGARIELFADAFAGEALLVDPVWTTVPSMSVSRYSNTASLLASGKVLVAGGYNGSTVVATAELYDPATNTWSPAGSMLTARYYHTAVVLNSGKVLVAGGYGSTYLGSAEVYDPSTNAWSAAGSMATARYYHAMTLLPNGTVLVAGGYNSALGVLASSEIYDPGTNGWSTTVGAMSSKRYLHTSTLLSSTGKVLVAGGYDGSAVVASAELYNPSTKTWSAAHAMGIAREYHAATQLQNNKVLVTGGYNGSSYLLATEIYDPSTDTWASGALMGGSRGKHSATLLANGKVMVAGGYSSTYIAATEIYDPSANTWQSAGSMISTRAYHTATLLGGGAVLVTGGFNGSYLASAELFDPAQNSWSATASLGSNRWYHTTTALPNGKVWVAGGYNAVIGYLSSTYLYDPSNDTWTNTATMAATRELHTATPLSGGQVLVAGGYNGSSLASAQVYDSATNSYVASVGSLHTGRYGHMASPLPGGKVLVAGGTNNGTYIASAEVYDPATKAWTVVQPMGTARSYGTAVLLASGQVLVVGGTGTTSNLATAELYNAATNTWTPAGTMANPRYWHTSTLLPSGKVLVAGGYNSTSGYLASAELYDPSTGWSTAPSMSSARCYASATPLANGWVVVAGGFNGTAAASSVDVYDPVAAAWKTAAPMGTARYQHGAALLQNGKVLIVGGNGLNSTEAYVPVVPSDNNTCTTDTWNAALGQVTHTPVANGTSCNDGNACTQSDTCQAGVCVGASPVVCPAPDQCHTIGICAPATGVCSAPAPLANGTSCNDGNACTQTDTCQAGTCTGSNPVVCAAPDQCHTIGTCAPATGVCSAPAPKADGTTCNDGNACTQADTCQVGTCTGSNPVVCAASDQCHVAGICNTSTGVCTNPAQANGTACNDGSVCTLADACNNGVCAGVSQPAGTSCSDNNACNGIEVCDGVGHCSTGTALPDGAACGGDVCAPLLCSAGQCLPVGLQATNGTPCGDGSPCKAGAVCQSGQCNTAAANGVSCSDGDVCNGAEICQNGACQPGAPIFTPDNDPCTTQACNPVTGVVTTTSCSATDPSQPGDAVSTNPGLLTGAVDVDRAAVLLGLVTRTDGATPIPNVTISILDGSNVTASTELDGHFALAVNGGGTVRVRYSKTGYLPVERTAEARWKEYTWLPKVVMTALDGRVTPITLGDSSMQPVRGSLVHDEDGVRQATVLFPAGTEAVAVTTVNGVTTSTPLSGTLSIRATEFTVGPTGRDAMPGPLPPATAYTYAVELTADEALGADSIQFVDAQNQPQPMPFYVENFINFPVGQTVPMGFYDRRLGMWVPSASGRVIKIMSKAGGTVVLATKADAGGNPLPPDAADEAALGITPAERVQLAQLYAAGQTLWRVPITHFTPWDSNWPYGAPDDACEEGDTDCQPADPAAGPPKPDDGCKGVGSVIECQAQVLGEAAPVAGAPYDLHYASDRAPGRREAYRLTIPVVGSSPPASLLEIDLTAYVAGKVYQKTFYKPFAGIPPYVLEWDGKDVFNRQTQGAQPASYVLTYIYKALYKAGKTFGSGGGPTYSVGNNRASNYVMTSTIWHGSLGAWDERGAGLGGWSIDAHHVYDRAAQVMYLGDGSRRSTRSIVPISNSVVGGGPGYAPIDCPNPSPQGCTASTVNGGSPAGVAVAPDGTVIFADTMNGRVRQVDKLGSVTTRISLPLEGASPLVRAPDGSLYVVTMGPGFGQQIKKIAPNNTVTVVAGNGTAAGSNEAGSQPYNFEGPAACDAAHPTCASVTLVLGLTLGPDGSLFYVDKNMVHRIAPDGTVYNFAGMGACISPYWSEGAQANAVNIGLVYDVFAAPNGDVYVSLNDCYAGAGRIVRVTPDGIIHAFAGGGTAAGPPDGHSALPKPGDLGASLTAPNKMTWLDDKLVFVDYSTIRLVDADGNILSIAGNPPSYCYYSFCGNGVSAMATNLAVVNGLTAGPDGSLYVGSNMGRVLRIASPLPRFGFGNIVVPSENGAEIYKFDNNGRHLETYDALTNALVRQFFYDSSGRLSVIHEVGTQSFDTTFNYSDPVHPAIVGPFGDVTSLALDANKNLISLTRHGGTAGSPVDEVYTMSASADGLLATFRDPLGTVYSASEAPHAFTYDVTGNQPNGRLTCDQDPGGGNQSLGLTSSNSSGVQDYTITKTTTQDSGTFNTVYDMSWDKAKVEKRTNQLPGVSTPTVETIAKDGTRTTTLPDQTTATISPHADPRFGMLSPTFKSTTTLPSPSMSGVVDVQRFFDAQGLFHETLSVNGKTFDTKVLADGHTLVYTTPAGRTWSTVLDAQGRMVQQNVASMGFGTTSVTYDPTYGWVASSTLAAVGEVSRGTTPAYYLPGAGLGVAGQLHSLTDPAAHTLSFDTYDRAGRPLGETLPGSRHLGFAYDGNGNTTEIDPPPVTPQYGMPSLQPQHLFGSSPMSFFDSYAIQDAQSPGTLFDQTSYDYTPDRQLKTIHRPENDTVGFSSSNDRLDDVALPTGEHMHMDYEPATGRVADVVGPTSGEKVTFGYNGNLVTSAVWSGPVTGSLGRTYDTDFRVASETVAGVTVNTGRDLDGLPTCLSTSAVAQGCPGGIGITYQPGSILLAGTTVSGTPISDSFQYNGFGEVKSHVAQGAGQAIFYQEQYTRDTLGRIATRSEQIVNADQTTTTHAYVYGYDVAGRLGDVTEDGVNTHYDYDANNNRLRKLVGAQVVESGVYDIEDHQQSYAGRSFLYTASGQLQSATGASGTTQYTYDALGNLRHVVLPASQGTIDYVIDGLGRRVGKLLNGTLVRTWLYSGALHVAAEIDNTTSPATVRRFVYGTRTNVPDVMIQGGVRYRIFSDHVGSPRTVISESGQIVARMDYDELGRRTSHTGIELPFGFAGGLYDTDTSLTRFGARDYDAAAGRWTAKDQLKLNGGSSNLYAYAGGDPLNFVDEAGASSNPAHDWASQGGFLANVLGFSVFDAGVNMRRDGILAMANANTAAHGACMAMRGASLMALGAGMAVRAGSALNSMIGSSLRVASELNAGTQASFGNPLKWPLNDFVRPSDGDGLMVPIMAGVVKSAASNAAAPLGIGNPSAMSSTQLPGGFQQLMLLQSFGVAWTAGNLPSPTLYGSPAATPPRP